ncbi:MAG TPA: YcxB family protein [Propionicimonas sp.]|nr:YcxB family protein [Propionicimonas sp.]HQA77288.1 YcxB family protein [Propionicimonas sp.]HQD97707.1 YcxB family protein [Propionicimonas sp.]
MLEFSLTEADLAAFAAFRAQESGEEAKRIERIRLITPWVTGTIAYLVVSLAFVIPMILGRQWALAGVGELVAIAVLAVLAVWQSRHLDPVLGRLLPRRYQAKAQQALARTGSERKLWLDSDGLSVAGAGRTNHIAWDGITRIADTDEHWFIYTGADAAHVLPKRLGAPAAELVAAISAEGCPPNTVDNPPH